MGIAREGNPTTNAAASREALIEPTPIRPAVQDKSAPLRRLAGSSVVVVACADLLLATVGPLVSRPGAMGPLAQAISFSLRLILFALIAKLGLRVRRKGGFGLAIGWLSLLLFVHSLALGVLLPSGRYLGTRAFLVMHVAFAIIVAASWVVTVTAAIKCLPEAR